MADNYLEKKYEEYERKKALYLKKKKLGLLGKGTQPSPKAQQDSTFEK